MASHLPTSMKCFLKMADAKWCAQFITTIIVIVAVGCGRSASRQYQGSVGLLRPDRATQEHYVPATGHDPLSMACSIRQVPGSPAVFLELKVTNVSNHLWEVSEPAGSGKPFGIQLSCNNVEVPMTPYGESIHARQFPQCGNAIGHTLAPSQTISYLIELNQLFEIARPGVYTVKATHMADLLTASTEFSKM
jgi:hypothetical protein